MGSKIESILQGIFFVFLLGLIIFFIIHFSITRSKKYILEHSYQKEYFTIVEKSGFVSSGKFNHQVKEILISRDKEPEMFAVLNSENWNKIDINDYWNILFYSKNIGDKLYFEYINTNRFWRKIK